MSGYEEEAQYHVSLPSFNYLTLYSIIFRETRLFLSEFHEHNTIAWIERFKLVSAKFLQRLYYVPLCQ